MGCELWAEMLKAQLLSAQSKKSPWFLMAIFFWTQNIELKTLAITLSKVIKSS